MAELRVRTSVDGSGFATGLQRMEHDAQNFGKNLSSKVAGNFNQSIMAIVPGLTGAIAGVFAADKIKAAIVDFAKQGEDIEFGSIRLNVDQGTYQRIDNVMKEVGLSADSAGTAFDKLADSMTKIEQGRDTTGQLKMAFSALGVSLDDLAKKDYQKIFFQIAESMKGVIPTKEQIAGLREVFGKGGDNLMPAFKIGFDSDFAKKGMLGQEDLDLLKEYNEQLRYTESSTRGMWHGTKMLFFKGLHAMQMAGGASTDLVAGEKETMDAETKARIAGWKEAAAEKANAALAKQHALEAKILAIREKMDTEDKAKASAIDKETAALKERNREAAMTPEQKRVELLSQIRQMEGELKFGGGDLSRADEAGLRKRIEEMKGEIAQGDRNAAKPQHAAALHGMGNQAIGGIMLGHDRLNEIAAHARTTAHHTASMDKKMKPPATGRTPHHDYP